MGILGYPRKVKSQLEVFLDSVRALRGKSDGFVGISDTNTAYVPGAVLQAKSVGTATAPSKGVGMLRWEAGTNAGTLKLVAYSGTSTTGVTVVDNVGSGN